MLSDEQRAAIHTALQKCDGNRDEAARLLGVTLPELTRTIHHTRELRELWSKKREAAPTQADTDAREVLPLEVLGVEKQELVLAKRDLKGGLKSLGLSDNLAALAESFADFQSQHFGRVLHVMGGGLVRRYVKMEQCIDEIDEDLAQMNGRKPVNNNVDIETKIAQAEVAAEREKTLRNDRAMLIDLQQKCYDRIVKAQLTLALAKEKENARNGPGGKGGKPGFAPKKQTLVHVQPGGTVNLNG